MKKFLCVLLMALMVTSCVHADATSKEIVLLDYYPEFTATVSGVLGEEVCKLSSEGNCLFINTDSAITFNKPLGVLSVHEPEYPYLNFDMFFEGDRLECRECSVKGEIAERADNASLHYDPVDKFDTVKYLKKGAQLKFKNPGHYWIQVGIAQESAEERAAFEAKYPIKEGALNDLTYYQGSFCVIVVDENGYVPSADEDKYVEEEYVEQEFVEEIYTDEPVFPEFTYEEIPEYDETLMSIYGIHHYDYERNTINYNDRVAVGLAPMVIEVKKDISMFTILPIEEVNGEWSFVEEIPQDREFVYKESYGGDVFPAKKGETFTLTEPGLYNIFAEEDYMGRWTELVVEVSAGDALYTNSKVMVDGKQVQFEAYNIGGNNYFKLRDIAHVLSGTSKQFEVEWDGVNSRVNMISGMPYTPVGGELAAGDGLAKKAATGTSNIGKDNAPVKLAAYLINGNNYFKLRDLGELFDFDVSWDGVNNCVLIDSKNSYTAD